jgi:hypothetical protein
MAAPVRTQTRRREVGDLEILPATGVDEAEMSGCGGTGLLGEATTQEHWKPLSKYFGELLILNIHKHKHIHIHTII